MKIYVIKTPEYDINEFKVVKDFFKDFEGPLKFDFENCQFDDIKFPYLSINAINGYDFDFQEIGGDIPQLHKKRMPVDMLHRENRLTLSEMFSICGDYRSRFIATEPESFVVLLTKWGNEFNLFSSFDNNRNIFVHVDNWEIHARGFSSSKYPIAYQIVANIISSLMNIEFDVERFLDDYIKKFLEQGANQWDVIVTENNEYVHEVSKGCINDFCRKKGDVILKLQSEQIFCPACIDKIAVELDDIKILKQVNFIFKEIRTQFTTKLQKLLLDAEESVLPCPLTVVDNKIIRIKTPDGNCDIELNAQYMALYKFLLKEEHGVTVAQLSDKENRQKLEDIYIELKKKDTVESKRVIKNLTAPDSTGFSPVIFNINKKIRKEIKDPILAEYYTILGKKNKAYLIRLPQDLVKTSI